MTEVRELGATGWGDKQAALEDTGRGNWPRIPMGMGNGAWLLFFLIKTKEKRMRY